ncbi:MAG: inorganic phosphate transporter [Pseudomonadota bacterium]
MELAVLIFLGSGLFLGWSLGANDAANVFGTAVGTRMVSFATAAIVCSVFVVLGAVISGAGAAHTLGKLGSINALAGSFMAALAAAATVYAMTRAGIPVSTSQAIVGAIVGWNLFSNEVTDLNALVKILLTWVACPVLAGCVAVVLFKAVQWTLNKVKLHLLRLDAYTRIALIGAGAFGAYSLGANNIANVMGVFVSVSPFTDFNLLDDFTLTSVQQLFLLGSIAIAVGVFTYSKKVMLTVGNQLMPMSPINAWVVVVAHSVVLFVFASQGLEQMLADANLPTIPLVPVSSSQAVIGGVIGLGLLRGGRSIRWGVLTQITTGWITTPFIAASICFVGLFFLQNVFDQQVYKPVRYAITQGNLYQLQHQGVVLKNAEKHIGQGFDSSGEMIDYLSADMPLSSSHVSLTMELTKVRQVLITSGKIERAHFSRLRNEQFDALQKLQGRSFDFAWELENALAAQSAQWKRRPDIPKNRAHNQAIADKLDYVTRIFEVDDQ